MPRGKRGKPPEDKPRAGSEVIQFRPPVGGGNTPTVETPAVDLSHLAPDDAVKILAELSALNTRCLDAEKAYENAKEDAKDRKKKWEALARQLQSKLKESVKPLPLFDPAKSERDLAKIQEAAVAAPAPASETVTAGGEATASSVEAPEGVAETLTEAAPEPPATGPAAQEPAIF